jgi:hypothetical protein
LLTGSGFHGWSSSNGSAGVQAKFSRRFDVRIGGITQIPSTGNWRENPRSPIARRADLWQISDTAYWTSRGLRILDDLSDAEANHFAAAAFLKKRETSGVVIRLRADCVVSLCGMGRTLLRGEDSR